MSLASILAQVGELAGNGIYAADRLDRRIKLPLVELTGGEPLAQPSCTGLMNALGRDGFTVLLETSGAMDTQSVPDHVHTILDVKTPSSGESHRFLSANLHFLKPHDEVKFVVSTEEDLEFTKQFIHKHAIAEKCTVLVSWAAPLVESQKDKSLKVVPASMVPVTRQRVVEYILQEELPVRFQLQMHKFIWPPDQKGV